MARSNNSFNRNNWTADRRSQRAIKGKQTQQDRKHERRDIQRSMNGDRDTRHERFDMYASGEF